MRAPRTGDDDYIHTEKSPDVRPMPMKVSIATEMVTTSLKFILLTITAICYQANGATAADKIDFSESSWRNPFTQAHWKPLKTGTKQKSVWSFDGKTMTSKPDEIVAATFRRPYRRLSLDLELARPKPTGAFEISLTSPDTKIVLRAILTETELSVSADEPDHKPKVLKKHTLKAPTSTEKKVHLLFRATGNRIIISHNNRRVLVCNQPGNLSGRSLSFSLHSRGSSCRVTRLRVDGE